MTTGGESASQRRIPWEAVLVSVLVVAMALLGLFLDSPYAPFAAIMANGLLTVMNPSAGLAVLLATIPAQDAIVLPFVRGELTLTQVALFGLAMGWGVTIFRYRIWLDVVAAGFLAVFATLSISLAEMDDAGLWVAEVYRWFAAAAVYLIARSILTTWQSVRIALYGTAAGVFVGTYFVVEQVYDQATSAAGLAPGDFRAMGAFGVPNPLAAYIEFSVPVLLVFALFGVQGPLRTRIGRAFWIVSVVASGVGLLVIGMTQSRGGYIGMAAALMVIWLLLSRRIKIGTLIASVILAGAFVLTPTGQSQTERFLDAVDSEPAPVREVHGGLLGRESLWLAGLAMIEEEPLTGIGAGEYDYHYREHVPEWVDRFPRGQAHNGWLQMGAQAGIPGIIAFSLWLGASFMALLGAVRRASDDIARLLAWGGVAVMVAFTLHSLVDYLNVLSLGIQLSAVTAIGLALAPDPLRSVQRRSPDAGPIPAGQVRMADAR